MAASSLAQSVTSTQEGVTCSICSSYFKEPKVLDCLHTFCLNCLHELRKHQGVRSTGLKCPVCGQETSLRDSRIDDLPGNLSLSALVEEATMIEQLLEGQESQIKCQSCEEENQVVSRCMDCNHFLCQECQKAHERVAVLKSHKIYTLAQLRSSEIMHKSKLREDVPKCRKHPDQNLNVYCNTCDQLVCLSCSVLNHGEHSFIGLSDAFDKCKRDVAELADMAEKNKTRWMMYRDKLHESHKKLDMMFTDTNSKISRKADEEVARIRQEEEKLKQEGERFYYGILETLETDQDTSNKQVDLVEDKLMAVNRLMSQMSCNEILNLKQSLLHNLRELTEKQPENDPHSLLFMDFEERESSLGTLVLEDESETEGSLTPARLQPKGKWELKKKLTTFGEKQEELGFVNDIAAFSNNEIIAVDTDYQQLITFMLKSTPRSTVISQRHKIKDLTNPQKISVNKLDQIIIMDTGFVKILNREYQLLQQFSVWISTCIAVGDNNQIALSEPNEIKLYNPDGSPIRTLHVPAPMFYYKIAICNQQFSCINKDKKKLMSINYDDDIVFLRKLNQSHETVGISPTDICCDKDGSFYITSDGKGTQGGIYHYSSDGTYIGCITKGYQYAYNAITLTPDGELVVAAGDAVHIYHRV